MMQANHPQRAALIASLAPAIAPVLAPIRRGLHDMLDIFLPPRCAACDCELQSGPALCGACWQELDFINGPICAVTGAPMPYDLGPQSVSLNAMMRPPLYDVARAAMDYRGTARRLIHRLKFHNRPELANLMSGWLVSAGAEMLAEADYLLPVPLHRTRLLARRYNQSAELARAVARHSGVQMQVEWVRRIRRTPQQIGMTRKARQTNLRGAFAVKKTVKDKLKGRRVVLLDDVMTTGATVNACSRVLRKAGVAHIGVLTVARVVMPEAVKL